MSPASPREAASGHARAWLAGAGAATVLAVGLLAAGVEAAPSGAGVKIRGHGFAGAQAIKDGTDVNDKHYVIRSRRGGDGHTVTRSGTSMAVVAELAGVSDGDVGFLSVRRPDGTTLYLSNEDIFHPTFARGAQAIVWIEGGSTHFLRPVRGSKDANAADDFATEPGSTLVAAAHDGDVLGVRATASQAKIDQGEAARFTAVVEGAKPGEMLDYRWDFGDGSRGSGKSVEHTFGDAGQFAVIVTVTASDSDSAGQGGLSQRVGKAPSDPGGSGGGGLGDGASGGVGVGDGGAGATTPPAYVPPYIPPASGYPPPADYGFPPPSQPKPPSPPGRTPPKPPVGTTGSPGLEPVSGTLIAQITPLSPAEEASQAAASLPSSSVVDLSPDQSNAGTVPLAGAGAALLFMLGGGLEARRGRRRPL